MYQDPRLIRQHRFSVNLDEQEAKLINALVDYTGCQKSTLLRQLIMSEAKALLLGSSFDQLPLEKQEQKSA